MKTVSKSLQVFSMLLIATSVAAIVGCGAPQPPSPYFGPVPGEVEATQFQGENLTPISQQNNNAANGYQYIDKNKYRLVIDGLVDNPLSLGYDDLKAYEQVSRLTELVCVEGWGFLAKWTGPVLQNILDDARVQPGATVAIFHTVGMTRAFTSLDLRYIRDQNIIIALKNNDITLPPERGFPFQVVAEGKFGYKWVKWVDRIEISSDTNFRGYWESSGYSQNADINGPAFD
jgi:DMSO/TMAO reductase YedYZ molybdopterin-dependent catalytic subunit